MSTRKCPACKGTGDYEDESTRGIGGCPKCGGIGLVENRNDGSHHADQRNTNLSNPNSDPEFAPLDVRCSVHFDLGGKVPKDKLQTWLGSLPDQAKVEFTGISDGRVRFVAEWREAR